MAWNYDRPTEDTTCHAGLGSVGVLKVLKRFSECFLKASSKGVLKAFNRLSKCFPKASSRL